MSIFPAPIFQLQLDMPTRKQQEAGLRQLLMMFGR